MSKKRDEGIDLAKGTCILLMILGHTYVSAPFSQFLTYLIYLVHMPVFFVINGYFFKKQSFPINLKKTAKTILVPLYVTNIINIPLLCLIYDLPLKQILKSVLLCFSMVPNNNYCSVGPVWFLACLFFVQILLWLVLCVQNRLIQVIIVLVSCVVGMLIGQKCYLPYSIDVAFVALLFSYVGYLMGRIERDEQSNNIVKKINHLWLWILFFAMYFGICVIELYVANEYFNFAGRTYPWGRLGLVISLFFTVGVVLLSKCIGHFKIFKPIVWVGKNSLLFLCVHTMDTYFFNKVMTNSVMDLLVYCLRVFVITILVIIIVSVKRAITKANVLRFK